MTASKVNQNRQPVIEHTLEDAFTHLDELRALYRVAIAAGIAKSSVPGEVELQCFALLGDMQRNELIADVSRQTSVLIAKGFLTSADLRSVSTPKLRMIAVMAPMVHNAHGVSQRIQQGMERVLARGALQSTGPRIRCPRKAEGIWGQMRHIRLHVQDAAWVLIRPDDTYNLRETLFAVEPDVVVNFQVPCDEGQVTIAAMDVTGGVSVQLLSVSTREETIQ